MAALTTRGVSQRLQPGKSARTEAASAALPASAAGSSHATRVLAAASRTRTAAPIPASAAIEGASTAR